MTKENKKKFDDLEGWQRHFIGRIIEHGDVKAAALESGVGKHAQGAIDYSLAENRSFAEVLDAGGITDDTLVKHLHDCLTAETVKFDKKGNPLKTKNFQVTLKAIELALKIKAGVFDGGSGGGAGSVIDLFEKTSAN